jgi:[ribosomal protein S5]-alanine N-acetyltransferase
MHGPIIMADLVSLQPPPDDFARSLTRWYADPAVTRYLNLRFPPTVQAMESWLGQLAASNDDVVWAIVRQDAPIGIVLLKDIDWPRRRGHLGIGIGEAAEWRKGCGTTAVMFCTRFAFEELGLEKVQADAFDENVASKRMLEKAGYRQYGLARRQDFRHGRWYDRWLCEILREEWLACRAEE